jgi:hypothetical protein
MSILHSPAAFWTLIFMQFLGLASAWFARVSEGSTRQAVCQRFFFVCLTVMGAATIVALRLGPGSWFSSGSTLAVMALAATCDFSRSGRSGHRKRYCLDSNP